MMKKDGIFGYDEYRCDICGGRIGLFENRYIKSRRENKKNIICYECWIKEKRR